MGFLFLVLFRDGIRVDELFPFEVRIQESLANLAWNPFHKQYFRNTVESPVLLPPVPDMKDEKPVHPCPLVRQLEEIGIDAQLPPRLFQFLRRNTPVGLDVA